MLKNKGLTIFLIFLLNPPTILLSNSTFAKKGIIDFKNNTSISSNPLKLKGQWELYLNNLLTPNQIKSNKNYYEYFELPVNLHWQKYKGLEIGSFGYGTYHLKVALPNNSEYSYHKQIYSIKIKEIHSAYKIWLNGKCYYEQGKVATTAKNHVPLIRPHTINFAPDSDTLDIVINFSNYFDAKMFGMDDFILLGTYDNVAQISFTNKILSMLCFGIFFVMGLYHILVYILRKKDTSNLFFGLIGIVLAFQTIIVEERIFFDFFPNTSNELAFKGWTITFMLFPLFNMFYYKLYPKEFNRKFSLFNLQIFSLYTVLIIFTKYPFYSKFINIFFIYGTFILLYISVCLVKAFNNKRPFSTLNFIGFLIPLFAVFNDILFGLDLIYTGYYAPYGFCIYIVIQSFLISFEFVKSYEKVTILSNELKTLNDNLEIIVKERTEKLNSANQELKLINSSKDRFISILSHDLKNPFHAIRTLSEILKDSIIAKDSQQSLEICNNIHDASSQGYKLLQDMLEWSIIQIGGRRAKKELTKISSIIEEAYLQCKNSADAKLIDIIIESNLDFDVNVDKQMITSALRNIISNSIKFTYPSGRIQVSTDIRQNSGIITIHDNGIGMSKEQLNKLFKLEEKVSRNGTSEETGTGLGLHLVKEFVEKNDGRISVESQENNGTITIIELPI